MKRTLFGLLLLAFVGIAVSACSGSDVDERFVKKWTLIKVVGADPKDDKILGINNIFFDLREDETMDARWYDMNSTTAFEDYSGKYLVTKYGEGSNEKWDLFLFYGPGQKKTKIFTVTKISDDVMIMNISNIDHIFKAK